MIEDLMICDQWLRRSLMRARCCSGFVWGSSVLRCRFSGVGPRLSRNLIKEKILTALMLMS